MRTCRAVPPVSTANGRALGRCGSGRRASSIETPRAGAAYRATREIWWRLAVVGRAMAELWDRRGLPDVPFLLPDRGGPAPQGRAGPDLRQHAGVSLRAVRPARTPPTCLGLARARCATRWPTPSARDRSRPTRSAMEFLKYRPLSMMLRELPGTVRAARRSRSTARTSGISRRGSTRSSAAAS